MNKSNPQQKHDKAITTVNEFTQWTKALTGNKLLYRGLANSAWDVEASGYRRIKKQSKDAIPPAVFQNYIKRLLDNASLQGFRGKSGRQLSDLELLAELQHNGAATCLIDFTANPLVALWFACQKDKQNNGQVIAMATDAVEDFAEVGYEKLKDHSINDFFDEKLWKWFPAPQNNRIVAQNSVFVFGKGDIEAKYYEIVEIKQDVKEGIIKELQDKFGVAEQSLFRDFAGFSIANSHNKEYSSYSAEDYLILGITYSQRGEHEKAIEYYSKAIDSNQWYAEAYNNRGTVKNKLGNYEDAIKDYNKAIELNPELTEAYLNRGNVKNKLGNYEDAIKDYNKAIELNPEFTMAYNGRGSANSSSGKYEYAMEDFNKAIELNPKFAEAYNNRGIVKCLLERHEDAIGDYSKAIELNPKFTVAYFSRSIAKRKLGDTEGAVADTKKVDELTKEKPNK